MTTKLKIFWPAEWEDSHSRIRRRRFKTLDDARAFLKTEYRNGAKWGAIYAPKVTAPIEDLTKI